MRIHKSVNIERAQTAELEHIPHNLFHPHTRVLCSTDQNGVIVFHQPVTARNFELYYVTLYLLGVAAIGSGKKGEQRVSRLLFCTTKT